MRRPQTAQTAPPASAAGLRRAGRRALVPGRALGPGPARRAARGFSFTEVLFAVMILGIGFIMVAAIFPVAIQQARNSSEETTAAAVSRGAANFLEKVASNSTMPATGNIVVGPFYDGDFGDPSVTHDSDGFTLADAIQGSLVVAADTRYAWVPFYRRAGHPDFPETWSPFAQVFMVPVLVRNEADHKPGVSPQVFDRGNGLATISGTVTNGVGGAADTIRFDGDLSLLSEGAFVILANATMAGGPRWDARVAPQLHGRIYRLGNPVEGTGTPPNTWELMPGFDFEPVRVDEDNDPMTGAPPTPTDGKERVVQGSGDLNGVSFYVVGRGASSASSGTNVVYEGPARDVSAYTTFVTIK